MRQREESNAAARLRARPISAYRLFPGVQSHLPFRLRPGLFRHRVLPTLVPVQLLQPPFFGRRGHGHRWSEHCPRCRDCRLGVFGLPRRVHARHAERVLVVGVSADLTGVEPAAFARFVFRQHAVRGLARRGGRHRLGGWRDNLDILLRTAQTGTDVLLCGGRPRPRVLSLLLGYIDAVFAGVINLFVPAFSVFAYWQAMSKLDERDGVSALVCRPRRLCRAGPSLRRRRAEEGRVAGHRRLLRVWASAWHRAGVSGRPSARIVRDGAVRPSGARHGAGAGRRVAGADPRQVLQVVWVLAVPERS